MKKSTKLLFYIIPIITLFLGLISFLFLIIPNQYYLEMFFKDSVFLKGLLNSFLIPFIVSFVLLSAFNFIRIKFKFKINSNFFLCYLITVILPFVILLLYSLIVNGFPHLSLNDIVFNVLISLQLSFLLSLVLWVIETFIFNILIGGTNNDKD